jgi:hypothetical protein
VVGIVALRAADVIDNSLAAFLVAVVLVAAPAVAGRLGRHGDGSTSATAEVPLERLGLQGPWDPDAISQLDAALGLETR